MKGGLNENVLVAVDSKNRIRIWSDLSLTNSRLLRNNTKDFIKSISFFPNGLLAVAADKTEIWNLSNDSIITALSERTARNVNALQSIYFMNKTYLLTASQDNTIRVWNETFTNIKTLRKHSEPVTILTYNSNLQIVASSSQDNSISVWSISFKIEAEKTYPKLMSAICILRNGLIATASSNGEIRIWKKLKNESELQLVTILTEHLAQVNAFTILKNNSLVSGEKDIKIWNQINESSFECVRTLALEDSFIYSLASFESALLLSGDNTGSIQIWNQKTLKLLQLIKAYSTLVNCIAVLNNGNLVTGSYSIKIWKKTNESRFEFLKELTGRIDLIRKFVILSNNMFASASEDKTIRIWDQTELECIRVLTGHTKIIMDLAILDNGNFVSVSIDQTAIIWDSFSFSRISTLTTASPLVSIKVNRVFSLRFFASNYLLSGHLNGIINVWKLDPISLTYKLKAHKSDVTCLTIINEQSFASGSTDKTVKIWNSNFKLIITLKHSTQSINAIVSLYNTYLISASKDRFITIYKTRDIQVTNELKIHSKAVYDIEVLDDKSQLFATCSVNNEIKIWNNSELVANLVGHYSHVYSLVYSANHTILISGSKDATIKLWNVSDSFSLITTLYQHTDSVVSFVLISKKNLFASGSCDYTIVIWNLTTLGFIQKLQGHSGCVNALALQKDKYLLSGSSDKAIFMWDIENGFNYVYKLDGHTQPITALVSLENKVVSASEDNTIRIWSPSFYLETEENLYQAKSKLIILNNSVIVAGLSNGEIVIWKKLKNKSTLQLVAYLAGHSSEVYALTVLKNNSLVSCSGDKTMKIWNQISPSSFECVNTLKIVGNSKISSLAVNENMLLMSGDIGRIYILNQTSFQLLQEIQAHSSIVRSIIVLDNGNLVTGSSSIKIWKKTNESWFEFVKNLTDHDDNIFSLAVLPNNMFASASGDKTIRIWDQAELECIRILTGHTVSGLAVVENEYLVSISDDTAIVWDSYSFSKIASVNSTAVNGFFSVCTYFDYSFITSDYEGRIQIWSQSLESSETLKGHSYTVTDLAVLNNG